MTAENPRFLRRLKGEMVIGMARSPRDEDCIGMTFKGRKWIFYTSQEIRWANPLKAQLDRNGIDSMFGQPFDLRASIDAHGLRLLYSEGRSLVGIFVDASQYGRVIDSYGKQDFLL